jgi:hypothetical protein
MRSTPWIVIGLTALLACSAPTNEAQGQDKAAEADKKFTLEQAKAEPVKVGAAGQLQVAIKPAKGYKWNEQFPASLKVDGASCSVASFTTTDFGRGDFKMADKDATVAVPVQGKTAGEQVVKAKASFSVCNDETCLIFRDEPVELKVTVR